MKKGWQTSTLGEVLAVLQNGLNCKQDKSGRGDKISRIESISAATFNLEKVGYADLSEREKEQYRLQPGDILFSHINSAVHVGKTALFASSEPIYHGVNLLLLRPKDVITSAYLDYVLKYLFQRGYWRGVCKQSVNQASVNQKDISQVQISYPHSLPEQQRIVAILDEAFAGIATAVANTEKNLATARELFDSYLNNVFTQESEGWTVAKVGEIVESSLIGLVRNKKEQDPGFPFRYLKMNNISNDNRLDDSKIVNVDANAEEIEKFSLRNGDFLFNTRNSHELVGKSCLFKSDSTDVTLFNNNIMCIRFKPELDAAFVSYAFSSKSIIEQLERIKSGTTNVVAIYYKTLQNVLVVFPPPPEQKRIVSRLNALSSETQHLQTLYQHKRTTLAELKQSLLHKAFSGALTSQSVSALQEAVA